ncbi:MAG TPA: hypothetical protein VI339_03145 [Steroidobacteraceae bacterium]|nr:hypothetical protein [Steroidobacteraceae bacterium]
MNSLRRAPATENHVLEFSAVAIVGFLLGNAVRMDWELLQRAMSLLFDI